MMAGCRNPKCSGKNPVLPSGWCTGSKCKDLRKQVKAAEKEATEQQARALAGVAAPAQCVEDGLQCWQVHSVHGQMECGIACLGGTQAPPADDLKIHYLVFGSFAATEDDDSKKQLRFVPFKEILKNCSEEDVKKLAAYEKDRIGPHRATRKRLYEVIEAEEEDVSDLD